MLTQLFRTLRILKFLKIQTNSTTLQNININDQATDNEYNPNQANTERNNRRNTKA